MAVRGPRRRVRAREAMLREPARFRAFPRIFARRAQPAGPTGLSGVGDGYFAVRIP